jgi:hypothetical protein
MSLPARIQAALLLGLAFLGYVGTDRWFAPIDDETEFVTLAHQPLSRTIEDYWHGDGQPEHPPLGGVLLHAWLPIGGSALWSLRVPSVLLYLGGILCLSLGARRIAGDLAFLAVLWIGVLWPFAFHFARLADWYSLSFFLVAALTLKYLRYLDVPNWRSLLGFVTVAVLLVYSTYYGWVVLGCLAVDIALLRPQRDAARFLLVTFGALAVAYLPLWRIFGKQVLSGSSVQVSSMDSLVSRVLRFGFNVYTLFVSESVAPWYWYASIAVVAGIVASIVLAVSLLTPERRRFLVYFAVLLTGMAVINIVNTKRLLSISGWLLLSLGLALAGSDGRRRRLLLAVVLASVAAVGWGGVIARRYYSAPHFIEPWQAIADEAAKKVVAGNMIVTDSPSLRFSLNFSLNALGLVADAAVPGWVQHPAVRAARDVAAKDLAGVSAVTFVRGVNVSDNDASDAIERWLRAQCVWRSTRHLLPDPGYALKARFFPDAKPRPYRISVHEFDCLAAAER